MTFISFGLYTIAVLIVAYIIEYILEMWKGHPILINKLVWSIALIIILVKLAQAVGFPDIQIPHF